ncbi:MAG: trigger factor, partial [Candidatus Paceibacterota bacterium]
MEFKTDFLPKSKIALTINLDNSDLSPFESRALEELGKGLKINGFRPGKIPDKILKENLSALEIYEKAAVFAVQEIYPEIIKKEEIKAIGYPNITITKIIPGQEVEFKAEVDIFPKLELPDYKALAKEMKNDKKEISVTEKEKIDALTWLQNSYAKFKKTNYPAKKGDLITIDFQIEPENKNDQKLLNWQDKNYSFILGEGKFLPGFEDNLVGAKEKEEKIFNLIIPQSWPQKDIQGKKIRAKVLMKEIKEKELPELNDSFAQSLGKFKNLEELKKSIEESLKIEKTEKEKERWRLALLEKIIQQTKGELPETLLSVEKEKMTEELKFSLESIQLPYEKYLEQIKKTEDELKKSFEETAKKRAFSSIILKEIAEKEKITVSEEEKEKKTKEILEQIPEAKEKEK